jgi:hypothetical protein
MKKPSYWLITVQTKYCTGYSTTAISRHPSEYIAKHRGEQALIFAMPITEAQYKAMKDAR